MDLELHIEQLVLHGFAPEVAHHLGEVVQHELQRLLAQRAGAPTFAASHEVARIDAGAVAVEPGSGAQQVGAALAQAIYAGMSR
jgi:hypothetical protein